MLAKIVVILKFIKWPYFFVTEIIGWAGIPGDVNWWGVTLMPFIELLDYWIVRASLVASGLLAVTYPKWLPWLRNRTRPKTEQKLKPNPLLKDQELQMLQLIDTKFGEGAVRVTTSDIYGPPFLEVSPGLLERAFSYLKNEGYIVAFPDGPPGYIAGVEEPSLQRFVVTRITEKGRKALTRKDLPAMIKTGKT